MSWLNWLYEERTIIGHTPTDNEKKTCLIASLQICNQYINVDDIYLFVYWVLHSSSKLAFWKNQFYFKPIFDCDCAKSDDWHDFGIWKKRRTNAIAIIYLGIWEFVPLWCQEEKNTFRCTFKCNRSDQQCNHYDIRKYGKEIWTFARALDSSWYDQECDHPWAQ